MINHIIQKILHAHVSNISIVLNNYLCQLWELAKILGHHVGCPAQRPVSLDFFLLKSVMDQENVELTSVTILARRQHQPATARSALIEKWRPRSQDSLHSLSTQTSSFLWCSSLWYMDTISFGIMYLFLVLVQLYINLTRFGVQEEFDLPPNLGSLHPEPLLDLLLRLLVVTDIGQHCGGNGGWVVTTVFYQHEVTNLWGKSR